MKYTHAIFILMIGIAIYSCSKWDDFKKYTQSGEIIYPGKMDSIKIYSGKGRVQFNGLLTADPKVEKITISWNDDKDSVVFPYQKKNNGVDTFIKTFSVDEGIKSFKVRTYDVLGNKSVDVFAIGTSYGENFRKRMSNRSIASLSYSDAGTTINWEAMDLSAGPQYTEVEYTDNGNIKTVITPVSESVTVLEGVSVVPPIKYRTIFRPDSTCIDTFATAYQLQNVIADVTNLYLSNVGPGFQRSSFSGRWGTLAAPWITNAGAKNKDNGINGGYTSDSRWNVSGQICWETWGNTPVVDGKIYQPTSKPLPAGNYTVTFHYYSEIQSNSSVYCVAAAGGDGIPSLPGLSGALGYALLYNGANVGATSPSFEETKSFSFTLTSPQVVSIGFLGNIVGSGNPGSYFVVQYVKLIKN